MPSPPPQGGGALSLKERINSSTSSVLTGKGNIRNALLSKEISVPENPTFQQLAEGVNAIIPGAKYTYNNVDVLANAKENWLSKIIDDGEVDPGYLTTDIYPRDYADNKYWQLDNKVYFVQECNQDGTNTSPYKGFKIICVNLETYEKTTLFEDYTIFKQWQDVDSKVTVSVLPCIRINYGVKYKFIDMVIYTIYTNPMSYTFDLTTNTITKNFGEYGSHAWISLGRTLSHNDNKQVAFMDTGGDDTYYQYLFDNTTKTLTSKYLSRMGSATWPSVKYEKIDYYKWYMPMYDGQSGFQKYGAIYDSLLDTLSLNNFMICKAISFNYEIVRQHTCFFKDSKTFNLPFKRKYTPTKSFGADYGLQNIIDSGLEYDLSTETLSDKYHIISFSAVTSGDYVGEELGVININRAILIQKVRSNTTIKSYKKIIKEYEILSVEGALCRFDQPILMGETVMPANVEFTCTGERMIVDISSYTGSETIRLNGYVKIESKDI